MVYLPGYFESKKLEPTIDDASRKGFPEEAIVIMLARDATRSLGRVLKNNEVSKIKSIVAKRIKYLNPTNETGNNTGSTVEDGLRIVDVFKLINQDTKSFIYNKGEELILAIPAVGLREPRSIRTTTGIYGGPSVRIAKGVYLRAGGSSSTSQSHEELKDIDGGDLFITNQRIFFSGKNKTANIPFKKLIDVETYSDAIAIHQEGRERVRYFLWPEDLIKVTYREEKSGDIKNVSLTGSTIKALICDQIQD